MSSALFDLDLVEPRVELYFPAAAVVVLLAIILAVRWRRRRLRSPASPEMSLVELDISTLAPQGPPRQGRQLTFYGVPVRLAAVVLAPVGRGDVSEPEEAAPEGVPQVLEALVPGLGAIARRHDPQVISWEPQVSTRGFTQAFFSKIPLPGKSGKGTRWASAAGRVELDDSHYLVGLVVCANRRNNLGQITIDRPGGWLDALRVREP